MALREQVRFYLEDIETSTGRTINWLITILVLLSLGIFVAETYELPSIIAQNIELLDSVVLFIFIVEYLLRLWSAEKPLRYFFSLYAIIDLAAILPFLFTTVDVRFIRVLRWFRILRLIRFIEGNTLLGYVSREDSAIFVRILFTLFSIIFVYSGLIYQAEHRANPEQFQTFLDAFYFSVVTMSTVGFGDVTPISELGRLLTVLMILTGIALIPWQLGDLVKQLIKTSGQIRALCSNCGLANHDADARFCKVCGKSLVKVGDACELPTEDYSSGS